MMKIKMNNGKITKIERCKCGVVPIYEGTMQNNIKNIYAFQV